MAEQGVTAIMEMWMLEILREALADGVFETTVSIVKADGAVRRSAKLLAVDEHGCAMSIYQSGAWSPVLAYPWHRVAWIDTKQTVA
jgi:hypothetical protein